MSAPLSFLLVGAGGISRSYVQALQDSPVARLSAVVDVREDVARALAERAGCRGFASLDAALAAGVPDAAIVCTPPSSHSDVSLALMDRGVHVLCEKPLSVGSASARRMVDRAAERGVLLTMGSKFRYVDDVIEAKAIVASGAIGEVVLFENAFTSRVDMARRWNADPAVSGGGVLIDNGTHSVDIVRYFLGPIAEVQAVEARRLQSDRVEDTARIFVRSVGGVVANVDLSWTVNKERESFIDVYGSNGTLRVGWKASAYRTAEASGWTAFGRGYDKVSAFRKQVDNFARAILEGEPLIITSEDALASVQVIDCAYRSLAQNQWVRVREIARAA